MKLRRYLVILLLFVIGFFFGRWAFAEPWSVKMSNDYVIPGGLDRFLTNAFVLQKGDWSLGNDMYTPRSKRSPVVNTGDRPWDGYTYVEKLDVTKVAFGQEQVLKSRIGLVGHASGSEDLQRYIHDDLGLGVHPTWAGQKPSEVTLDFILSRRTREYVQSAVGDSQLTQEYGARFGNVNDSLFLDQELRKHFGRYFYVYAGLRGDAVAYNTHLDGRLFHDNEYTVDRQWFVASARAGIELYFPKWHDFFVTYGYSYLTEEFQGQDGRHAYGTLTFGTKF